MMTSGCWFEKLVTKEECVLVGIRLTLQEHRANVLHSSARLFPSGVQVGLAVSLPPSLPVHACVKEE